MIVLDAGALIALINERDSHHLWARDLFASTTSDDWMISTLNLAEVMVHPVRAGKSEEFLRGIEGLHLRVEEVSPDYAIELATLRAETSLKMPDVIALHLARSHSGTLATVDGQLAQKAAAYGCDVVSPALT